MIGLSSAWTRKYTDRVLALEVTVGVAVPFVGQQPDVSFVGQYTMLWDTGATGSVITPKVVRELGLKPIDRIEVRTANGSAEKDVYMVNLLLPNNKTIDWVRVTESNIASPGLDGLLGMDVIGHGDFAITHANGNTVVSFRMPSCAEIDYDKERTEYLKAGSVTDEEGDRQE